MNIKSPKVTKFYPLEAKKRKKITKKIKKRRKNPLLRLI